MNKRKYPRLSSDPLLTDEKDFCDCGTDIVVEMKPCETKGCTTIVCDQCSFISVLDEYKDITVEVCKDCYYQYYISCD